MVKFSPLTFRMKIEGMVAFLTALLRQCLVVHCGQLNIVREKEREIERGRDCSKSQFSLLSIPKHLSNGAILLTVTVLQCRFQTQRWKKHSEPTQKKKWTSSVNYRWTLVIVFWLDLIYGVTIMEFRYDEKFSHAGACPHSHHIGCVGYRRNRVIKRVEINSINSQFPM